MSAEKRMSVVALRESSEGRSTFEDAERAVKKVSNEPQGGTATKA